jgi:adenylate cyclase
VNPVAGGSQLSCAECGTGLRASARFCDACGTPVDSPRPPEERKQLTVLFADVVGSMKMAAALDPERLREIMHDLFNRSASVVQRYQGTVDKFTGDGLMALFGAPAALEDHALRACIAALELQSLARELAIAVRKRDGMDLRIRVGLNSGEVIAGDFGSATAGYTVTGHTVGMAQRMEAAAGPGAVLCSASTASLVEYSARLGPWDNVVVKGFDQPVPTRRLEGIDSDRLIMPRDDGPLMGRDQELRELVESFRGGSTSVVSVIGEPGLGKSRLIREFAARATAHGAQAVITRCEAHMANVPLRALSRMMRAVFGVRQLDAAAARLHIINQVRDHVDPRSDETAVLFDVLGIADAATPVPTTTTEARRHMLIALMNSAVKAWGIKTAFIVEDLHWVDTASDEFLADLAVMLRSTDSMLVANFRPEYQGRLRDLSDTAITLSPLTPSTTVALAAQLIGEQPTACGAAELIAQPSAGNPFFVEEIVRDLVGRSVLSGNRGDYQLACGVDSIAVPATVQTVLAARIDRLSAREKSILNAAAVIGTSFGLDNLRVLIPDVEAVQLSGLVTAELIDQIELLPEVRYAFRHPLVRAVCYDSQLITTRASSHGRLAMAIAERDSADLNENSALIAHHFEAAGQMDDAYTWYMRAGDWLKHRDMIAARDCWQRAQLIADRLPEEDDAVCAKRIAPRAQVTATAWLVAADSQQCYDELRELTTRSDDWLPLAVGMSGRLTTLIVTEGRIRDGGIMAAELEGLIDRIASPPALRAEILTHIAYAQYEGCAFDQALRTTERLHAIPEANPSDLFPSASVAGVIKVMTGRRAEGLQDLRTAIVGGRETDPVTYAIAVSNKTDLVDFGFDLADGQLVAHTRDALIQAEAFGDVYGIALARLSHGTALIKTGDSHRATGIELLELSRSGGIDIGGAVIEADLAVAKAPEERPADQIDILEEAVRSEIELGEVLFAGYPISVLVGLLIERNEREDAARAEKLVAQLEELTAGTALQALHLWPMSCRARLAAAIGDVTTYRRVVARYLELARELDAPGHNAVARQFAAAHSLTRLTP